MTDDGGLPVEGVGPVRPRTIPPDRPRGTVALRPRTIGALGRPSPMVVPAVGSFLEPSVGSATGQLPAVGIDEPYDDLDEAFGVDLEAVGHRDQFDEGVDTPELEPEPKVAADDFVAPTAEASSRRLVRNNLAVASGTAMSRVTGLIRTVILLVALKPALSDTYLLANNTPNIIYELILGGVLTATLVPIFTGDIERRDKQATDAVISFTIVALVVLTLLAALVTPLLMLLYGSDTAHGVSRHLFLMVGIKLAILFAPQVFFYGLMALWSAVLNARDRFFAAAWAPVLNNVIVIAVLLTVYHVYDRPSLSPVQHKPDLLLLLGLGTTAGIAVMTLALYPALRRSGMRLHFHFDMKHPAVRRAVRLSGWTFGYVIANQIAAQTINVLAHGHNDGVTHYQTAFQFFQLPHGLLAVSIMTTFEPMLGRAAARLDWKAFNDHLLLGLRLVGLLVIPAAIGYIAIPTGLGFGALGTTGDLSKVLTITAVIAAFAAGLPGFSAYLFSLRGFYALKDTRTPFYINCVENLINIAVAVVFVRFWGIVGLALAYGVAYTVAAGLSFSLLMRRSPGFDRKGLFGTSARLVVAAAIMGGSVVGVEKLIHPAGNLPVVLTILAAVAVGVVVYFAAVVVLRVPGIDELAARLPILRNRRRAPA